MHRGAGPAGGAARERAGARRRDHDRDRGGPDDPALGTRGQPAEQEQQRDQPEQDRRADRRHRRGGDQHPGARPAGLRAPPGREPGEHGEGRECRDRTGREPGAEEPDRGAEHADRDGDEQPGDEQGQAGAAARPVVHDAHGAPGSTHAWAPTRDGGVPGVGPAEPGAAPRQRVHPERARRRHHRLRRLRSGVVGSVGPVVDHAAVAHPHDPLRPGRDLAAVGDHEDRLAGGVQPVEQVEHLGRTRGVQRARGLVGEQQRRPVRQRPRDRHALALPARQRAGPLGGAVEQAERVEQVAGAGGGLGGPGAGDERGQRHVLQRRQVLDEVEELEHQPDVAAAQPGEPGAAELLGADAGERDGALVRPVQPRDEVQQRRLAAARRPHQRDELAGPHGEVGPAQRAHGRRAVGLAQTPDDEVGHPGVGRRLVEHGLSVGREPRQESPPGTQSTGRSDSCSSLWATEPSSSPRSGLSFQMPTTITSASCCVRGRDQRLGGPVVDDLHHRAHPGRLGGGDGGAGDRRRRPPRSPPAPRRPPPRHRRAGPRRARARAARPGCRRAAPRGPTPARAPGDRSSPSTTLLPVIARTPTLCGPPVAGSPGRRVARHRVGRHARPLPPELTRAAAARRS